MDAVDQAVQLRLVATGPWSTVSTGSSSLAIPSKLSSSAALTRPRMRIS